MLENFEIIEPVVPKERPKLKHITLEIPFTYVKSVKEWENALLGVNPLTEMVLISKSIDETSFHPIHFYYMTKKQLFYAVPLDVLAESIGSNA